MRKFFSFLSVVFSWFLALAFALFFLIPSQHPHTLRVNPTTQNAAHHIVFHQGADWNMCSSTAVGPHTLLSAAHCVLGTGELVVDGDRRHIVAMTYDERDHVLVGLDGAAFADYLPIDTSEPLARQHIHISGWPGDAASIVYRDGTFIDSLSAGPIRHWQLPVYAGDSGSALVTDEGKIIAVVSQGNESADCFTFPFAFTSQQLQEIK